ncbi:MAG TPA: EboA domain-containing protein [Planctomycetota bacterium]|nr:EboA domain-containing protein [Planctomycetota bacterium]
MSRPTTATLADLAARLDPAARGAIEGMLADVQRDRSRLSVVFPGLPRRIGRDPVRGGRTQLGPGTVDLDAFRQCDLAAAWLLLASGASDAELWDLYAHGDIEERAMLLRALHLLPVGAATVRLLGEVQRTNMVLHLEAAVCDGDLFARTTGHAGFDLSAANKLLLKLAFLDLPLQRAFGAERHANAELSRMLQDLATEREAAGRAVWRDTWRLIGRAPCPGSTARLVGGLEHGDDGVRLAAAEGLLALVGDEPGELRAFAAERLPREPREPVRTILQRIAAV